MLHAPIRTDRPRAIVLRNADREGYLAYLRETGLVVEARLLADAAGEMVGSRVVIEAETRAEAEPRAAGDTYPRAGLCGGVEIRALEKGGG